MPIARDEVRHVAALCRLAIPAGEEDGLAEQLGRILGHFRRLAECDVAGVPATSHVGELGPLLREDAVGPSLPLADAMANAPAARGGLFLVPRVVEDAGA